MKYILIVSAFLSLSGLFAQQSDTMLNFMRSTRINNGKRVTLRSKITDIKDISVKTGKDHYNLRKDAFKGADSVDIEVNKAKQIAAISFLYDMPYDYEKGNYTKHFKIPGKEYEHSSDKMKIKVTRWEDKLTAFELVEVTKNGKTTAYSTLFDKELYSNKKKVALKKEKEGSFEILKQLGKI
jgi:hypothetical protein